MTARAVHYEDQRRRAAEFVDKAVTTALMDGPPANLEPPPVSDGWQDGPYDGQEKFIRAAIEQFQKHAPGISLDTPASNFAMWPPSHIYGHATKMSRWNKNSASVQSATAMFKVRHAFWRFIASAIVYRKRQGVWPTMNWPSPEFFLNTNTEPRYNKFLETVHSWANAYLRSAGIIR